jgi:hypothetical protein
MHGQYSIYTLVLGGAPLRHVEDAPFDPKIEEALVSGAGSLFPLDQFVAAQKSQFQIKTHDLFRLLGPAELNLPIAGAVALGTTNPSYYQYRKRAEGGWATGDVHLRLKSFAGTVWINDIETAQDDKKLATANLTHHCLADDSGNFVDAENGVALTGEPAISNAGYILGPMFIDVAGTSTLIEGNTKFRFDSGLMYADSPDAGKTFARQGATHKIHPKFSFNAKHLPNLIAFTGGKIRQARIRNHIQYLQAIGEDGYPLPPTTPAHIRLTIPEAKLVPNKVNPGSETADASIDYVSQVIWPDQTDPTAKPPIKQEIGVAIL